MVKEDHDLVLKEINQKVVAAATAADFDEVIRLAKAAKELQALKEQERLIHERKKGIIAALEESEAVNSVLTVATPPKTVSAQQRGKEARSTFVQCLANDGIV